MTPNRLVGTIFGVVYLLVGLLGFFARSDGFVATGRRQPALLIIHRYRTRVPY